MMLMDFLISLLASGMPKEGVKMAIIYDYVFVTHLPAFYKINLYNKLAENLAIFVIFISDSSKIRTQDFTQAAPYQFDYKTVNQLPFEGRNKLYSGLAFIQILQGLKFKKIVLGGWDLVEFWLAWLMLPKEKLAVAIESSIHESQITGLKFWVKKLFISKIRRAYVSGVFQEKLMESLGFNQTKIMTGGVGLIHPPKSKKRINYSDANKNFRGYFLYLGRLSQEKNIALLLNVFFNYLTDYHLTFVGKGPLDNWIKSEITNKKINNVKLMGHVPNSEISQLFYDHDVLILPSQQEPWGLVVEEAMAHGIPAIVSDKVGCHSEVVKHKINGYIFRLSESEPESELALEQACHWAAQNYSSLADKLNNTPEANWLVREKNQLAAYIKKA